MLLTILLILNNKRITNGILYSNIVEKVIFKII